ncbi:class I SAM-dependent methyltransferase [Congregibacter sp.]|uniref:class I SAM-dependent methyltransferase n=1 Tax=Congregibacter sp. TaxID=2744308 RepID=UPI00385936C0
MLKDLQTVARWTRSIPYRGSGRVCTICNATATAFLPFGTPQREEAQCWRCHSLERHRFMWHYIANEMTSKDSLGLSFLHIAPEACISNRLRQAIGDGYITADLFASNVDVQMDITDIQLPDNKFDSIYCSHVLEHVEDDNKALSELFRVLKPDGTALLAVPISGQETYEDSSIVLPEERLKAFGQSDHVRIYGLDFADRVAAAGFKVTRITPETYLTLLDRKTFGITEHADDIFLAEKPSNLTSET